MSMRYFGEFSAMRSTSEGGIPAAGSEGIALIRIAAFKATIEPADSLLGRAVGEGLGAHVATRHLLNAIVANRGGCLKTRCNIGLVDHLPVGGRMRPDTGEAVRLQLHHDGKLVSGTRILLLKCADLGLDAEHVLHLVANLMSYDIGLGKVAGGAEAAQLIPETKVQVNLLIVT